LLLCNANEKAEANLVAKKHWQLIFFISKQQKVVEQAIWLAH